MTFPIAGIQFSVAELVALVLAGIYLPVSIGLGRTRFRLQDGSLHAVFWLTAAAFLLSILVSFIGAYNQGLVIKAFLKWSEIFVLIGLVFWFVDAESRLRLAYWFLWGACVLEVVLVLVQVARGELLILDYRIFPGYPSLFAFGLVLPFFSRRRPLIVAATVACFLAAVLSMSRGVWLGLALMLIIRTAASFRVTRVLALSAFAAISIWLIAGTTMRNHTEGRLQSGSASNLQRMWLLDYGIKAFGTSPVTGVGALNFPSYLARHDKDWALDEADLMKVSPHNFFLQIAAEEGLLGVVSVAGMFAALAAILLRSRERLLGTASAKPYVTGLVYFALAMGINVGFGYIAGSLRFYLAAMAALVLATSRIPSADERSMQNAGELPSAALR